MHPATTLRQGGTFINGRRPALPHLARTWAKLLVCLSLVACGSPNTSPSASAGQPAMPSASIEPSASAGGSTAQDGGTASPTPASPPPWSAGSIETVDMATAWGVVHVIDLPTAIGKDRMFGFAQAATPDGRWLIGTNMPRTEASGAVYAVLYSPTTRQMVTMRQLTDARSQIIWAWADDRWVVWTEAADDPNFFAWHLYAYDRVNGSSKEIAQASMTAGKPVPGPLTRPFVDHGRVVWAQFIGPFGPGTLRNAVVRMANLATGATTTLAVSAGQPTFSWPWVSWGVATGTGSGHTLLTNLETGAHLRLDVRPATLALTGTSVAYNDADSQALFLIDDIRRKPPNALLVLRAEPTSGIHFEWPTLSARILAWAQVETTLVYDRAERRLVVLPVSHMAVSSWVGGRLLVWYDSIAMQQGETRLPAPIIHVIDTTTLPVKH